MVSIEKIMGQEFLRDEESHLLNIEKRIEEQMKLCKDEGREFDIYEKIKILQDYIDITTILHPTQMKSKTQTYDIRDNEELKGVLEIEILLQSMSTENKINDQMAGIISKAFDRHVDKNDLISKKI